MSTVTFFMKERFGAFLSNGDTANAFRFTDVEPVVREGGVIVFDFEGITNMTDGFGNALFCTLIEDHPALVHGGMSFKNCNPLLQTLVQLAIRFGCNNTKGQTA